MSKENYEKSNSNVQPKKDEHHKLILAWPSVIVLGTVHCLTLYAVWLILTFQVGWKTILFHWGVLVFSTVGVTGGAHRLWSHSSYKAKLPLRILLALGQTVAFQKTIYEWVREHRVHHKYSETNADPHNVKRGFFFAHMGWLLVKKHPDVAAKGKTIDISDVLLDPVVRYQKKYYSPLAFVFAFYLPCIVPVQLWEESFLNSFILNSMRFAIGLNITGLVNSIAHLYGNKPYDRTIAPTESLLCSILTLGEGWHNYHHAFPSDYKTAELGFNAINFTTGFLNSMAYIGQAYDLKSASGQLIRLKCTNKGDGSWRYTINGHNENK